MAGSVARLAANVAVAEPSLIGRVIAAWPSFALTASYEPLALVNTRGAAAEASPHFCDVAVTALRRCHDIWASFSRVCVTRMPDPPAG